LQNQSATAVAQVFSASQMRIKLIARIMAEGVRDIFALLHGTIRKHGQQAQTVLLRNARTAAELTRIMGHKKPRSLLSAIQARSRSRCSLRI
jgi:hypothetical protein